MIRGFKFKMLHEEKGLNQTPHAAPASHESEQDESARPEPAVSIEEKADVPEKYQLTWKSLTELRRIGMPLQYFLVGLVYGSAIALVFPVYQKYLGAPSQEVNTVNSFVVLGFSLKVFYGFLSDTTPIFGQRRKPYLVLGWTLCTIATLAAAISIFSGPTTESCYPTPGQGPSYPSSAPECMGVRTYTVHEFSGTLFGTFLLIQNLCYMFADVAMDSLSIEWARREPAAKRGKIQTCNYVCRAVGFVVASIVVGFGFNYPPFGGTWDSGLSLAVYFFILAGVQAVCLPFFVLFREDQIPAADLLELCSQESGLHTSSTDSDITMKADHRQVATCGQKFGELYKQCSNKAYGSLIFFNLFFGLCLYTLPVAQQNIKSSGFVHMTPEMNALNQVWGNFVMGVTLALSGAFLANKSWRIVSAIMVILLVCVGLLFIPIIYGGLASPWYYMFITMDGTIVQNIGYLVSMWASNELVLPGLEGTAYALTTTATNVSMTLAQVFLTNAIGSMFPSLADLEGSNVKNEYMYNYAIVSAINLLAIAFLPLLPRQKAHAQERLIKWGSDGRFGIALIVLLATMLVWTLSTTIGSMICPHMTIWGGDGSGC